ncbi:MAG TPA: hypothetical protein PKZ53_23835, partial [Acidobacteriota bacterium]|nr:hypothetical protein [Acidobacteriota bacterium]
IAAREKMSAKVRADAKAETPDAKARIPAKEKVDAPLMAQPPQILLPNIAVKAKMNAKVRADARPETPDAKARIRAKERADAPPMPRLRLKRKMTKPLPLRKKTPKPAKIKIVVAEKMVAVPSSNLFLEPT